MQPTGQSEHIRHGAPRPIPGQHSSGGVSGPARQVSFLAVSSQRPTVQKFIECKYFFTILNLGQVVFVTALYGILYRTLILSRKYQ